MSTTATNTKTTVLRATDFSCPSCVAKIEKRVGKMKGVDSVNVKFATARIEVVHDSAKVSVDDLVAEIGKAGYTATPSAF